MGPLAVLALPLLLLLLLLPSLTSAVLFKMDANGKQCISEDAGSDDVIVHATYNVTSRPDPNCRVDIRVRSQRPSQPATDLSVRAPG
jgi:hypothetical protein